MNTRLRTRSSNTVNSNNNVNIGKSSDSNSKNSNSLMMNIGDNNLEEVVNADSNNNNEEVNQIDTTELMMNDFTVSQYNSNGLSKPKCADLLSATGHVGSDFVMLAEIKSLKDPSPAMNMLKEKFDVIKLDRPVDGNTTKRASGGVALLFNRDLYSREVVPSHPENVASHLKFQSSLEILAVKLHSSINNNKNMVVASIYNPPSRVTSKEKEAIWKRDLLNFIDVYRPAVIAGDWNARHSSWDRFMSLNNTRRSDECFRVGEILHQVICDKKLSISAPWNTTKTGSGDERVIDFALFDPEQLDVRSMHCVVKQSLSDHQFVHHSCYKLTSAQNDVNNSNNSKNARTANGIKTSVNWNLVKDSHLQDFNKALVEASKKFNLRFNNKMLKPSIRGIDAKHEEIQNSLALALERFPKNVPIDEGKKRRKRDKFLSFRSKIHVARCGVNSNRGNQQQQQGLEEKFNAARQELTAAADNEVKIMEEECANDERKIYRMLDMAERNNVTSHVIRKTDDFGNVTLLTTNQQKADAFALSFGLKCAANQEKVDENNNSRDINNNNNNILDRPLLEDEGQNNSNNNTSVLHGNKTENFGKLLDFNNNKNKNTNSFLENSTTVSENNLEAPAQGSNDDDLGTRVAADGAVTISTDDKMMKKKKRNGVRKMLAALANSKGTNEETKNILNAMKSRQTVWKSLTTDADIDADADAAAASNGNSLRTDAAAASNGNSLTTNDLPPQLLTVSPFDTAMSSIDDSLHQSKLMISGSCSQDSRSSTGFSDNVQPSSQGCSNDIIPPITLFEMKAAIAGHNKSSSADFMGIDATVLSHLPDCFLMVLAELYHDIMVTGYLPRDYKLAIVTPLLKPGKPTDLESSYRPVSVTLYLARTLERIAYKRITRNLQLSPEQFGFREGTGVVDALVPPVFQILDGFEGRNSGSKMMRTMMLALDFTDAFCRVAPDHVARQYLKLNGDSQYVDFIRGFMTGRAQRVKVGNSLSAAVNLDVGVPQGTVLGPLMFSIAVESIIAALRNKMVSAAVKHLKTPAIEKDDDLRLKRHSFVFYADDSVILVSGSDVNELRNFLQDCAKTVFEEADKIGLKISKKSSAILFDRYVRQESLKLDPIEVGDDIKVTIKVGSEQSERFLGVLLSSNMCWNAHLKKIMETASRRINLISRFGYKLSVSTRKKLYLSKVFSILTFGAEIWLPNISKAKLLALERLHVAGARMVTGAVDRITSKIDVLEEASMPSLEFMVRIRASKVVEKLYARSPDCPARKRFFIHFWDTRNEVTKHFSGKGLEFFENETTIIEGKGPRNIPSGGIATPLSNVIVDMRRNNNNNNNNSTRISTIIGTTNSNVSSNNNTDGMMDLVNNNSNNNNSGAVDVPPPSADVNAASNSLMEIGESNNGNEMMNNSNSDGKLQEDTADNDFSPSVIDPINISNNNNENNNIGFWGNMSSVSPSRTQQLNSSDSAQETLDGGLELFRDLQSNSSNNNNNDDVNFFQYNNNKDNSSSTRSKYCNTTLRQWHHIDFTQPIARPPSQMKQKQFASYDTDAASRVHIVTEKSVDGKKKSVPDSTLLSNNDFIVNHLPFPSLTRIVDASVQDCKNSPTGKRSGWGSTLWVKVSQTKAYKCEGEDLFGFCDDTSLSFTAEMVGLLACVKNFVTASTLYDLEQRYKIDVKELKYVFFTDSMSTLETLKIGPGRATTYLQSETWLHLMSLAKDGNHVLLFFIYSHCNFIAHDEVDALAARAASRDQTLLESGARRIELNLCTIDDAARRTQQLVQADFRLVRKTPTLRWSITNSIRIFNKRDKIFMSLADLAGYQRLIDLPFHQARYIYRLRTGFDTDIAGAPFSCQFGNVNSNNNNNMNDVTTSSPRCPHCGYSYLDNNNNPKRWIAVSHIFTCPFANCLWNFCAEELLEKGNDDVLVPGGNKQQKETICLPYQLNRRLKILWYTRAIPILLEFRKFFLLSSNNRLKLPDDGENYYVVQYGEIRNELRLRQSRGGFRWNEGINANKEVYSDDEETVTQIVTNGATRRERE